MFEETNSMQEPLPYNYIQRREQSCLQEYTFLVHYVSSRPWLKPFINI